MARRRRRFDDEKKALAISKLTRKKLDGDILIDAPMREFTSFRIGGTADIVFNPASIRDVVEVVRLCARERFPLLIVGAGSNLLVLDGGIRGIVMRMGAGISKIRRDGAKITVSAGAAYRDVARFAQVNGLSGLEFAYGIPGSVGGCVCMNAGAYGRETSDVLSRSAYIDADGSVAAADNTAHLFSYRHSQFLDNPRQVIIETEFSLVEGNPDQIAREAADLTLRRASSQPLDKPSAGSVFKRPEGKFVGAMIEECGLKGFSVGGASISRKHAGFIVNNGGASAADVIAIIDRVKADVLSQFGVNLETEIRVVGENADAGEQKEQES